MAKYGLRDRDGTIAPVYPSCYNRVHKNKTGLPVKYTPPPFYTDYTELWNNGEWYLLRVLTYTDGRSENGYEFKRYDAGYNLDSPASLILADTLTEAIKQL